MSTISINGIRVGLQMYYLGQYPKGLDRSFEALLYETLARNKVNLPCMGLENHVFSTSLSCCFEGELPPETWPEDPLPVCMVSVYPHGSKTRTLGFLLEIIGRANIPFSHMVSSNAMISFVVNQKERAAMLSCLESAFDLPPTHTPYEPGFHEETAAFVKKRYQETRAYFQEKRIKTYGFALDEGLTLISVRTPMEKLGAAGSLMQDLDNKFYFSTAMTDEPGKTCHLHCLVDPDVQLPEREGLEVTTRAADLVFFHGPHFGDRFGIYNAAATCLEMADLTPILAGCTGASVSLVMPRGQGRPALPALEKGFETP